MFLLSLMMNKKKLQRPNKPMGLGGEFNWYNIHKTPISSTTRKTAPVFKTLIRSRSNAMILQSNQTHIILNTIIQTSKSISKNKRNSNYGKCSRYQKSTKISEQKNHITHIKKTQKAQKPELNNNRDKAKNLTRKKSHKDLIIPIPTRI